MNFASIALNDRNTDSEGSDSLERFETESMEHNPDRLAAMQQQLAEMQNVMRQQQEIISGLINAARNNQHQPPTNSIANDVLRQFVKSPAKFFAEVNPRKPRLSFDGSNYTEWETAVDRALQHAFDRNKSFLNDEVDNFALLDSIQNTAVSMLMRSNLDNALLSIVESHDLSSSKALFELLKSKCKRSGSRHKIILVEKILKFASENSPASESWLARFCAITSDIESAKVSVNELAGLILQSLAKAPPGTDAKNFEYSVSQPLDDMATTPTFGDVTTVIQSALSKINKGSSLPPGSIPSDVEMSVNAINHRRQNERYEPPHRRNGENNAQTNSSKFLVEKAAFYRGKGHTESLKERYGYNCLYCGSRDHWYSDCNSFWEDVRQGRVAPPPPNHDEQGSKYVPPTRTHTARNQQTQVVQPHQSNGRIRKIDVPDANDGTVLIDSGSTINVSGKSAFFTITSKLQTSLTVSLAISKYMAPIDSIGHLRIPTPMGVMVIDNVYYCEGIKGSILSTGRLVRDGWKFCHEGTDAWLVDKNGKSYTLDFSNYCWNVKTLESNAMINKITQKPSSELHLWHCRLGHASEPVVRKFIRKYLPDLKL
jgi:hypothetical protein